MFQVMSQIDHCLEGKKEVIGLIKYESGRKIMEEFAALRAKTYSYLRDNNNKD